MPLEVILPPSVAEQRQSFNRSFTPPGAAALKLEAASFKPADEQQAGYFREYVAVVRRKERMGVEPMTVLNLNPFKLELNSPLFRGLTVEPCPLDKPYTYLVIREPRYEVKITESGMLPADQDPFFLADAFKIMYSDKGGVVVIRGDIEANPEILNAPEVQQMKAEAKQQAVNEAVRLKQEADGEWNTPTKGSRTINDMHRNAARVLLHERLIDALPEWISAARTPSERVPVCRICQTEPKKGQILCTANGCGYILDPMGAFLEGLIDEHHEALRRLTRAQLETLNLTREQVPETLEERNERLAEAVKKPKAKAKE